MSSNPWDVSSLDELLVFRCPECIFHTRERNDFIEHAKKKHTLSFGFFGSRNEKKFHEIMSNLTVA